MNQQIIELLDRIEKAEAVIYNIDHAASMVSLVAENILPNDEASALWGANALLKMTSESIEVQLDMLRRELVAIAEAPVSAPAKKRGRPAKKKRGRPAKKVAEVV